jgi:hypothetical protein
MTGADDVISKGLWRRYFTPPLPGNGRWSANNDRCSLGCVPVRLCSLARRTAYLNEGPDVHTPVVRTGMVMLDFPGGGLINKIISYN